MEKIKVNNSLIANNFTNDVKILKSFQIFLFLKFDQILKVVKWRQLSAKICSSVFILLIILVHGVTGNQSILNDFTAFISSLFKFYLNEKNFGSSLMQKKITY